MGMNAQLEANTQALSRAQQDKAFTESLLNQQEANWKASQIGQNPETAEQAAWRSARPAHEFASALYSRVP